MPNFRVKFSKLISNDIGHESEICQGSFVVSASDSQTAVMIAQPHFCASQNIPNWRLRADFAKAEEIFQSAHASLGDA